MHQCLKAIRLHLEREERLLGKMAQTLPKLGNVILALIYQVYLCVNLSMVPDVYKYSDRKTNDEDEAKESDNP
jgi:hypothetical protein